MYIGKRVKELRKMRQLTLVELSEKSGVQVATLSRMENNKMTGTLESHINIAKALGIDVTKLYGDIIKEENPIDVHSKPSSDVFVHNDKTSQEILTSNTLSKQMVPSLIYIEPGGQTAREENKLGTEKFVYILEGQMEAHIDNTAYPLSRGNSMYFDASLKHFYKNKAQKVAKVLSIVTPATL